jgi:glycosyltransferase involved in cell wall biosynthesis
MHLAIRSLNSTRLFRGNSIVFSQIKRGIGSLVYQATSVPAALDLADAATGRPTVVGFFRSPSGIGQSARLCYAALSRLGLRPQYIDLSPRFQPAGMLAPFLPDAPSSSGRGPIIIHANPPELPAVTSYLGRRVLTGRMIVGFWAWELAVMPALWRAGFRYVHEVWAPSTFCAELFRMHTSKPVRVVFNATLPIDEQADRACFGIPADAVAFLSACDLRSSIARKNPIGAIRAFQSAFGQSRDQFLFLKITGAADSPRLVDVLRQEVGESHNIAMWTTPMSSPAMRALYPSVDCILSLHRAEGCGMIMVEGMLAGRCVIGTDWPGCNDFLTRDTALPVSGRLVSVDDPQGIYGGNQQWMEPDMEMAVTLLQQAATDDQLRRGLGDTARRHTIDVFGDARYRSSLGSTFHARTGLSR